MRALKHRFGPTGELGVFEMTGQGLVTVEDPSGRMLGDRLTDAAGSAVAVTIEGRRAVVLEAQALLVKTDVPTARRSATGFDQKRLAMLLAVMQKQLPIGDFSKQDAYLSIVGGLRVSEPGADLAVCGAIASSIAEKPLPADLIAIGEVGLAGEVRSVGAIDRRLAEAARLGFNHAIIPARDVTGKEPLRVTGAVTLRDAIGAMGLLGSRAPSRPGIAAA